jgi:predicted phage terminase large subunit-like protein
MKISQDDWLTLEKAYITRRRVRTNLLDWAIEALKPHDQVPAAHHRLLLERLSALTDGRFDRLMVLMPPGAAKSTYASVLFPAWWFTQHARSSIIAVSHTYGLAQYFSRRVRDTISAHHAVLGYDISKSQRLSANWHTSGGGEYIASGVRGGITGRRADLIIIDDPVKSSREVESSAGRNQIWSWYRSDLATRLKPNGRIVVIMTRWHVEDLCGQLLAQEGPSWEVLKLPAIAEGGDPLGRQEGEALWPDWEDSHELARKRNTVGSRAWASLFQQAPHPPGGALFKPTSLVMVEGYETTESDRVVRGWDLAATNAYNGADPDWTVGVKVARDGSGHYTVLDVIRLRGSPKEVEDAIASAAACDGPSVWISLPEDPGQAGKSQISYLARRLAGYKIIATRESGSKQVRAIPLASQIEAGNVSMMRASWNYELLRELTEFPFGAKDDQVDALVRAVTTLFDTPKPAKVTTVPFLAR